MIFRLARKIAALVFAGSVAFGSQLILTWNDNSTDESGFKIERASDGVTFSEIATVGANVTTYTDTNLSGGTTYSYRVRAYNSSSTSSYSNVTSSTAPADPAPVATPAPIADPAPVTVTVPAPAESSPPPAPIQPTVVSTPAPVAHSSRLVNLAVRAVPGTGEQSLIVGFVVGASSKSILVRAIGPGLSAYTTAATFPDPSLTIVDGSSPILNNDNWSGSDTLKSVFTQVGAFPLSSGSKDAVVLADLAPKAYTATVNGAGTGVALAEIYDADKSTTPTGRLVNISARALAGTGNDVLIVGFVIAGDTSLRVLIRGIGPTLTTLGLTTAIADPQLDLYSGGTLVQHNDNWNGDPTLAAAFTKVGAFALPNAASKDAALIATLAPGAYTAIVSGVNGTSGVALAEVYELP